MAADAEPTAGKRGRVPEGGRGVVDVAVPVGLCGPATAFALCRRGSAGQPCAGGGLSLHAALNMVAAGVAGAGVQLGGVGGVERACWWAHLAWADALCRLYLRGDRL